MTFPGRGPLPQTPAFVATQWPAVQTTDALWVRQLVLHHLRSFAEARLDLTPGINVITGPNGAGKTSLLEAVYLLSHGHSFRAGGPQALLRRGAEALDVFAELLRAGSSHRLGLGRRSGHWEARLDGRDVALAELLGQCAVVCFEPGSHALISGPPEERRRFMDWGVFHVEPSFLGHWRRYRRALEQRNALLRHGVIADVEYRPWEEGMGETAALLDQARARYLEALQKPLTRLLDRLIPELGCVELRYRRGWPADNELAAYLAASRLTDQQRGHTSAGSHRAVWSIHFAAAPQREHLSRGQEKLVALACLLAQAAVHAEHAGFWPIIAFDDLASELDRDHQRMVVDQLLACGAQVLVTGTEIPDALSTRTTRRFHVEQGGRVQLIQ